MNGSTVLVIEDEADIRELIAFNLTRDGFTVKGAETAEKGLESIKQSMPDIVLLDMMLPGMDGLEALRRIRGDGKTARLPVIMVTARTEDSDIVLGLELGADDYLCKPFSPRVLVARVRTRLREIGRILDGVSDAATGEREPLPLRSNGIVLDAGSHDVSIDGKQVFLTPTEFSYLEFFMQNPGRVFSRTRLIDAIHGQDYSTTDRSVDVQILALRKKMGKAGEYVETVRGIGYRYRDPSGAAR